jgi:hypothetical protein
MADNVDTGAIENALRSNASPPSYVLRMNKNGKSDVWNNFYYVYASVGDQVTQIPDICACVKCKKVYRLCNEKMLFGTSNLTAHLQTPAVDLEEPPTKSANTSDDIFSDFRSIASTSSASAPSLSPESHKLTEELRRYKTYQASAVVYDKQDPLQFWKAVEGEFPVLSVLARQVLCICATSAQSERDFSSVGLTITQLRSRLSAEKVEAIQIIRSAQTAGIVTNEFALAD